MRRFLFLALATLLAATPAITSAWAAPRTAKLTYDITVWDVPIGEMHITIALDDDTYQMKMSGGFGGIAALFSTGDGNMEANGIIRKNQIVPHYMHQNVAWDDVPRTITIQFDDEKVTDYKIDPPYNFNPDNRHALDPATLAGVRDPLSATIQIHDWAVPACSHVAKVFDGRERYDLMMVADPKDPWRCKVTPKLIGGYKKKHDLPKDAPKTFEMHFRTILNDRVLVPWLTKRPMQVGNVRIKLTKVVEE